METQKTSTPARVSPFSLKKAFRRFEDLKTEFFRIQWTEEGEVTTIAKVVVLATFICGMVLYLADLVVQRALTGVDSVLRLIFG
jgi:preprotein translocase subunit SecE